MLVRTLAEDHDVLEMFWRCSGDVLEMFWRCKRRNRCWSAPLPRTTIFWRCSGDVLEMFWKCSGDANGEIDAGPHPCRGPRKCCERRCMFCR
eukprot:1184362-Prorocentrum_minimum.AAC.2